MFSDCNETRTSTLQWWNMPGYYVGNKNVRGLNYSIGTETDEEMPFRRAIK